MTSNRTILITGVTGQQGGAVAQALQGAGFHLRGLTRKPDSERAAALARLGIDIVKGDLDDESTLRSALSGAWGVFGVQNAGEAGVEREEAQGKRLATLAREAGVETSSSKAREPWLKTSRDTPMTAGEAHARCCGHSPSSRSWRCCLPWRCAQATHPNYPRR